MGRLFTGMAKRLSLIALFLALRGTGRASDIAVTFVSSVPSPALVGTKVSFTATTSGAGTHLWYQFRLRDQNGEYRTVRDYSPVSSWKWTAWQHEGAYDIEVSVRDLDSGGSTVTSVIFEFARRVIGNDPVVSSTDHPLVFLYSAPGCPLGQRMSVEFTGPDGLSQLTPVQDCDGRTMNFYMAGLRAQTTYSARSLMQTRGDITVSSAPVTFTTGALPAGLYSDKIVIPSPAGVSDGILLGSAMARSAVANDLAGNVVWFGPSDLAYITSVDAGGYMWGLVGVPGGTTDQQLVRKFDLTGMTVLETNAARVNEQLLAMGHRPITAFHHEATPLLNDRVVVLGGVEQIVTDIQGPGPIDVMGDMVVVLDKDLNVVWAWDTFDHLDLHRKAVLGETCPGACPPMLLAKTGNDWTHGNSVQPTLDGNLLYSPRHQDWLIKIAYNNGDGDGRVLWRLGKDGDFAMNSTDPYPWFSHQHDANFEPLDAVARPLYDRSSKLLPRLMLFDNGNTRITAQGGHSRGQVLEIDEVNRKVSLILNADLGVYSIAVGAAEKLGDGNFHFDAGYVPENGGVSAHGLEVTPDGTIVYGVRADTPLYRSFRMRDMYNAGVAPKHARF